MGTGICNLLEVFDDVRHGQYIVDSNIALSLSLCCSNKGFRYALGFNAALDAMRKSKSRMREESDVQSGGYGRQGIFMKPTLLLLARGSVKGKMGTR